MESRPCSKLGHLAQKSRSLSQIIENHILYIRSKICFTTKLIALRSRFESFEIFTSKLYVKVFQELVIAKLDEGSGSYFA